jgi:hypothetical protein
MNARRTTFVPFIVFFLLGACSGDVNPVRDVMVDVGLGKKAPQAPDFVEKTRSKQLDYTPIGIPPASRRLKAKTAAEVHMMEQQLDQVRAQNENQALMARQLGATPPPAVPIIAPLR